MTDADQSIYIPMLDKQFAVNTPDGGAVHAINEVIDALECALTENPLRLSYIEMLDKLKLSRENFTVLVNMLVAQRDALSQSLDVIVAKQKEFLDAKA